MRGSVIFWNFSGLIAILTTNTDATAQNAPGARTSKASNTALNLVSQDQGMRSSQDGRGPGVNKLCGAREVHWPNASCKYKPLRLLSSPGGRLRAHALLLFALATTPWSLLEENLAGDGAADGLPFQSETSIARGGGCLVSGCEFLSQKEEMLQLRRKTAVGVCGLWLRD